MIQVLCIFIIVLLVLGGVAIVCRADTIDFDKLLCAVIEVESGGDSTVVNFKSECIGLCQIHPSGALAEWNNHNKAQYTKQDLFNAEVNTKIGKWYLKRLHDYYDCITIDEILAAYNFGIGNLRRYGMDKLPKETRGYIKKVNNYYSKKEKS